MKKAVLGALFLASLPIHAQEVPKGKWVEAMKTAIPAYFFTKRLSTFANALKCQPLNVKKWQPQQHVFA